MPLLAELGGIACGFYKHAAATLLAKTSQNCPRMASKNVQTPEVAMQQVALWFLQNEKEGLVFRGWGEVEDFLGADVGYAGGDGLPVSGRTQAGAGAQFVTL